MTDIIIIREIVTIGIGQMAEIEEFHLVVGYSVDKFIETDQDMNRITGMILEEEILEVM